MILFLSISEANDVPKKSAHNNEAKNGVWDFVFTINEMVK
jgi:hypothetical protein